MKSSKMSCLRGGWRFFLVLSVLLLPGMGAAQETSARQDDKPNIIIIIADDLGYGDTSVYDGWVKTPQLERMADQGMVFTDFHSNSSVCSPTRAGFMTGRYQQRVGIVDVVARHLDTPGLQPAQGTFARMMKSAGYRTALFGKWHLGTEPDHNPVHHGFDEFKGYLSGYVDYHSHRNSWYDGLEKKDQEGYTTHVITDNALRFIENQQANPFFLCVAHEAVHLPFQTPADTPDKRKPIPKDQQWNRDRIRPKYKIMLEEMDKGIGQILDMVNQCGIARKTLVFFFSDNGAIGAGSNKPFRGGKFSHYEGGHRVPAIAWWPDKIKAGSRTDALTTGMDIFPTVLDLASIAIPQNLQLDGLSMKDLLLEQAVFPERKIYFGYEPKLGTAMRDQNWKMIVKLDKVELYDLTRDITERHNVAEQYPDRTRHMHESIRAWKKQVAP